MLITKAMYADFCEGRTTEEELSDYLQDNFTIKAIIKDYLELLKQTKVNNTKITVDKQEYNAILSLFRVRGIKEYIDQDGKIIREEEKRGRNPKPKDKKQEVENPKSSRQKK